MLHTVTSITGLPRSARASTKIMGIEILITFNMTCLCESLLTSEGFTCYNLHSPFSLISYSCFPYQLTSLSPNVNLQNLFTGLHTFLVVLVQRTSFY